MLHAQRRGDGARVKGRQDRRRKLPAQQLGKKPRPLKGEGCPLSPAASSAPNYGNGNGGRSSDSPLGGKEMAPTKTGAKDGGEKSPRSSSAKNLSLRRGGPSAEPGGLIGAKLWRRRWGLLGGIHAQRRQDGTHLDKRQGREGELSAQQIRKNCLPEGGGVAH